jgi:hypothetical protein
MWEKTKKAWFTIDEAPEQAEAVKQVKQAQAYMWAHWDIGFSEGSLIKEHASAPAEVPPGHPAHIEYK